MEQHPCLRRDASRQAGGCPPSDRLALCKALIAKAVWDFATTRNLIDAIRHRPALRRLCGWGCKKNSHNPRRGEKIEFPPAEAMRYKERSAAERVNSHLHDEVYSTLQQGNDVQPLTEPSFAHTFETPVRRGRNLVVIRLVSGTGYGCRIAMETGAAAAGSPPSRLHVCSLYRGPLLLAYDLAYNLRTNGPEDRSTVRCSERP